MLYTGSLDGTNYWDRFRRMLVLINIYIPLKLIFIKIITSTSLNLFLSIWHSRLSLVTKEYDKYLTS